MRQFDSAATTYKAIWVNQTCKLLWQKYNGDLSSAAALRELGEFWHGAQEYVRNIYEVVNTEIPLFAYYQLKVAHGFDEYMLDEGITEQMWEAEIIKFCKKYYS